MITQEIKRQQAVATIKDPDTDTEYTLLGSAATGVILQFMDPNVDAIRIFQDSTGKFIVLHKGQGCTCKLTYEYIDEDPLVVTCTPLGCPDVTPPVITGEANVTYEAGATVTAAQFVVDANIEVSDDSGETIAPVIDLSDVDFDTAGTYVATVTATDSSGNEGTFMVTVIITA